MQHLIDDIPEQVALLSENCTIVAVNRAWAQAMEALGYDGVSPGDDYRAVCAKYAAERYEPAQRALAALDEIASGERTFWEMTYRGRDRWSSREFQMCFHRVAVEAQTFITITRFDLTEIAELRRLKDEFTTSLIAGRAMERQRLARELHDSTAQLLAAVGLLLGHLKRQSPTPESLSVMREMEELVSEAQQEIRSISYLSHPAPLDKMTFAQAVEALLEGFGRRSGVEVSFEVEGDAGQDRSPGDSALYRVAQEALLNVQRHARASRVQLRLCFRKRMTHLFVIDDGIGISTRTLSASDGTGVSGMRSRLAELGGRLIARRRRRGTLILASIPTVRNC